MNKYLIKFAILISISACSLLNENDQNGPGLLPVSELNSAPDTLIIGNQELVLRTYMWRDFQPISPPGGKPLVGIFWIYSADSTDITAGLSAEAAWLINENDIWDTYLTGEDPPSSQRQPYQLYEVARNGPKWEPGIEIDVVLRLQDKQGGVFLIRASNQPIGRTH